MDLVLLEICEKTPGKDSVYLIHCIGYIEGVIDLHYALVKMEETKPLWCLTEGVTVGQIILMVVKDMKENPKDLHKLAINFIGVPLIESFPCKKE